VAKPKVLEIAGFWKRPDGAYVSAPVMDDRIQDVMAAMQEGPVRLFLKPVSEKRSPRAADAHLLAIPLVNKRK
jgi:hypothetical protein